MGACSVGKEKRGTSCARRCCDDGKAVFVVCMYVLLDRFNALEKPTCY